MDSRTYSDHACIPAPLAQPLSRSATPASIWLSVPLRQPNEAPPHSAPRIQSVERRASFAYGAVIKATDAEDVVRPVSRASSLHLHEHLAYVDDRRAIDGAISQLEMGDQHHYEAAACFGMKSELIPLSRWEMQMQLEAFPADAEYYSASEDNSEDGDHCDDEGEGVFDPMGTGFRIPIGVTSRPVSRLSLVSNTSSVYSSDDENWIDTHFELVNTPSHSPAPPQRGRQSHYPTAMLTDTSHPPRVDPMHGHILVSHSPSSMSLSIRSDVHFSSTYADSMPVTPTSSYTVDVERDQTSLPLSPLVFATRSQIPSTDSLPLDAPHPEPRLSSPISGDRWEEEHSGDTDMTVTVRFVAEDLQTQSPTSLSSGRDAEASDVRAPVAQRYTPTLGPSGNDERSAEYPATASRAETTYMVPSSSSPLSGPSKRLSLTRRLGSFVARRLSFGRQRSNSAASSSSHHYAATAVRCESPESSRMVPHASTPRTSLDEYPTSPRNSTSYPSPRVSFSPLPPSPSPLHVSQSFYSPEDHDDSVDNGDDDASPFSEYASRSRPETRMTVHIERDEAGPIARLMRRVSVGHRRTASSTSFVLASTRVLPGEEEFDAAAGRETTLSELDRSFLETSANLANEQQSRRWSTGRVSSRT